MSFGRKVRTCVAVTTCGIAFTSLAAAQEPAPEAAPAAAEGPETSFSVSLNQDTFFGFYGVATGGVEVAEDVDLTFYAIQWTTPLLSAPGPVGPWTEFGVGVNFDFMDGALSLNPQLGVLNGVLLSGSTRPLAFEGIVPNLTMGYDDGLLEGELYFGYYVGLRGDSDTQNDFVHYWLNAGVKATSWLSLGAHWEHLMHTRGAAEGADSDLYQWLGGYVQFAAERATLRFTAGADLVGDDLGDFYKVSVGMDF